MDVAHKKFKVSVLLVYAVSKDVAVRNCLVLALTNTVYIIKLQDIAIL